MIPNLPKPDIAWDSSKRIFVKEDALSYEVCNQLIADQLDNLNPGVDKYPNLFTTSFHSCLLPLNHSIHEVLQDTFKEIIDFFDINVDFIEPYEIKKYVDNDYFGTHVDNYFGILGTVDRKITLVFILSDDYSGGDLTILGKSIHGKKGSVIAFPSFFPHSVSPVSAGERWSLITWMWGSYWK